MKGEIVTIMESGASLEEGLYVIMFLILPLGYQLAHFRVKVLVKYEA